MLGRARLLLPALLQSSGASSSSSRFNLQQQMELVFIATVSKHS
jgi:hypothetical protein